MAGNEIKPIVEESEPQLTYSTFARSGGTAKLLQIVESIRHYASLDDNKLPASLDEIDLPIPLDPFTGKSAVHEVENGVATLRWPTIPNVGEKLNSSRQSYRIKIAETK